MCERSSNGRKSMGMRAHRSYTYLRRQHASRPCGAQHRAEAHFSKG